MILSPQVLQSMYDPLPQKPRRSHWIIVPDTSVFITDNRKKISERLHFIKQI